MSKIIYHNHHIVPKYRCKEIGIDPDFPENIIRLTRLEHGQAHYERWLKHKDPRDLSAAQILAGSEIDGIDTSGEQNPMYGRTHSEETIKKMQESAKGRVIPVEQHKRMMQNRNQFGEKNPFYGKTHTEEVKRKQSEKMKKWWAEKKMQNSAEKT